MNIDRIKHKGDSSHNNRKYHSHLSGRTDEKDNKIEAQETTNT